MALVVEELGTDGARRGLETQRVRWARDSVLDLQRFIRAYRTGHTTRYDEVNLTQKGYAHLGTLPTGAKPKAFYIVSEVPDADAVLPNPNTDRNRLDHVAWEDRLDRLVRAQYQSDQYLYTVSPFSKQFLVHPIINADTYLSIVWDGLKLDFANADEVPFPSQAAEAVGEYVKAKIARIIDRRLDLAAAAMTAYATKRLALYREEQESQTANGRDEEYGASSAAPPTPPS